MTQHGLQLCVLTLPTNRFGARLRRVALLGLLGLVPFGSIERSSTVTSATSLTGRRATHPKHARGLRGENVHVLGHGLHLVLGGRVGGLRRHQLLLSASCHEDGPAVEVRQRVFPLTYLVCRSPAAQTRQAVGVCELGVDGGGRGPLSQR